MKKELVERLVKAKFLRKERTKSGKVKYIYTEKKGRGKRYPDSNAMRDQEKKNDFYEGVTGSYKEAMRMTRRDLIDSLEEREGDREKSGQMSKKELAKKYEAAYGDKKKPSAKKKEKPSNLNKQRVDTIFMDKVANGGTTQEAFEDIVDSLDQNDVPEEIQKPVLDYAKEVKKKYDKEEKGNKKDRTKKEKALQDKYEAMDHQDLKDEYAHRFLSDDEYDDKDNYPDRKIDMIYDLVEDDLK